MRVLLAAKLTVIAGVKVTVCVGAGTVPDAVTAVTYGWYTFVVGLNDVGPKMPIPSMIVPVGVGTMTVVLGAVIAGDVYTTFAGLPTGAVPGQPYFPAVAVVVG
jgi:hypothetical protein